VGADKPGIELVPGGAVGEHHRRAVGGRVAVAPALQADEDRPEVAPLVREQILVAGGPFLVAATLEDALVAQPCEPVAEDVAGDAEARLELLEAPRPAEGVAQDEQRPAVPDDLQGPGDRAVLVVVGARQHEPQSTGSVA